jgi:glutathione S-transferase
MITLYTFGPAWGLPDPSPFVTKAATLLRIAGLAYRTDTKGFLKAPRGKLPYILDGDTVISDSTMIRLHIEQRHNIDFDRDLTPQERAVSWAVEKLCEDHLYWLMVHARWIEGGNFERGPARFFKAVPVPARPLAKWIVRRKMRSNLRGQGTGRYTQAERTLLAGRAFESISTILGERRYLMGEKPCGADATVFAFVSGSLCPVFETALCEKAGAYPNLVSYCERLAQEYFPGAEI